MKPTAERIAILLPSLEGGGAERTMLTLARGLSDRGYDIDLVLVHHSGALVCEVPEKVRVIDLNAPRKFSSRALSSLPAFVAYLKQNQPAIVYTGLMTNLIAVWAKRLAHVSSRVVISERSILSNEVNQFPQDIRFRLMPLFVRLFYPQADCIIAVSQAVADDLSHLSGICSEKIKVIYNPVITPASANKALAPLDHPWFSPDQPPVILAVGRLTPLKDFPTLIRAIAKVRQNRMVRLIILGEGEDRNNIEELCRKLDIEQDVQIPGFIKNPYPYMKKSSLFVLSSKFEGLPGVIIEALFCGIPVIATDCPGGTREILGDGKYGQLTPVGDSDAMADAIQNALYEKHLPLTNECWKRFELGHILDQYISLFDRIAAR